MCLLVREQVDGVHRVHHHRVVDFEDQQLAVARFGAVDAQVVERGALVDGAQRAGMTPRKLVEALHEGLLLRALGGILVHAGVEVVHHPVRRNRHVAGKRLAVDQRDPEFTEQAVRAAVVDER
jgi:hypothetical protein